MCACVSKAQPIEAGLNGHGSQLRCRRSFKPFNNPQVIMDAARELFVEEGFENVSMRRIAEKIEYSPTTIYLYFEDKLSLLYAICQETFAKLAKRLEAHGRESADPVETLKKGCRAYIEFGLKHPNHYKLTFITLPQHPKVPGWKMEDSMGMKAYGH